MSQVKLITLDPGHFHAALVQKEMHEGVARMVHVFAPLGPDLLAHLGRVAGFNARTSHPTAWDLEVHAGPEFLDRMLRERPGNVVVLSGRNRNKIDYIRTAVGAGLNVLADKPWIIAGQDLSKLQAALDEADARGLVACDIMTERFEVTSILQRELVNEEAVFGSLLPGTPANPGVFMESVHYLLKQVAGVPLRRPAWFFDIHEQGEALTDVGTHLVDLVSWILFPDQPIDAGQELAILSAERWPTLLSRSEFSTITGDRDFSDYLSTALQGDQLAYYCNNRVSYRLRGVHVRLDVVWKLQAEAGTGDSHHAVFQGSRSRVEVRQGSAENYVPQVYVVPRQQREKEAVFAALQRKVQGLQKAWPGIAAEDRGEELRLGIPECHRVGHEAHFGEVTRQFLRYLEDRSLLPAWEKPNMLAKYTVTTQGVEQARRTPHGKSV